MILVTGSDGFIGSHLVEALVLNGHDVRAFTYYNSFDSLGWLDTVPASVMDQVEVYKGDIRDPDAVRDAVRGCTDVYHLAALIGIPYSYRSPQSYVETNITGTLNIVQAAKDFDIQRVILTSTSEVYGTAQFVPITEAHPVVGQSPYSATKIGADQIAMSYYLSFQTPVTIVRPFNTYGPRQSARAVIPTVITQLARGETTLKLGTLHTTRDFNYVTDTVGGFLAAGRTEKAIGEVINIGSGYEISIGDTAAMIADIMNVELNVEQEAERMRPEKSEVERLWAANDKARKVLGWVPEFAGTDGLRRGLMETIDWFGNDENLSRYRVGAYTV
jgi:NAD dependent epimerase/dehydratase